jgi:hypothetical protein
LLCCRQQGFLLIEATVPFASLTPDEKSVVDQLPPREKVAELAAYALIRLGSTGEPSRKYSPEIISVIRELYPEILEDITPSTLKVYLFGAPALNPRVASLGTAQGYYYDQSGRRFCTR